MKLREDKFGRLSCGWVVGSTAFRAGLRAELRQHDSPTTRFQLVGADRLAVLQVRTEIWEERLRAAAHAHGIKLDQLPGRKSAPEKLRLAATMKATTSASNRWLAQRLQMGAPSGVTSLVHRFRATDGGKSAVDSKFQT